MHQNKKLNNFATHSDCYKRVLNYKSQKES